MTNYAALAYRQEMRKWKSHKHVCESESERHFRIAKEELEEHILECKGCATFSFKLQRKFAEKAVCSEGSKWLGSYYAARKCFKDEHPDKYLQRILASMFNGQKAARK